MWMNAMLRPRMDYPVELKLPEHEAGEGEQQDERRSR